MRILFSKNTQKYTLPPKYAKIRHCKIRKIRHIIPQVARSSFLRPYLLLPLPAPLPLFPPLSLLCEKEVRLLREHALRISTKFFMRAGSFPDQTGARMDFGSSRCCTRPSKLFFRDGLEPFLSLNRRLGNFSTPSSFVSLYRDFRFIFR